MVEVTFEAEGKALELEELQRARAIRGTQVVQRFASTLCLREIRTQLSQSSVAPAWSTSNTISFSEQHLPDLGTENGVLGFKGLSFHEIAHILFTPRAGSDIADWVLQNGMGRAYNALEDQRIETLLVGRFGEPVVPWLTAVVVQQILTSASAVRSAFPLVRGRKYLPLELRQLVRDNYAVAEDVAELSSIIDEYRLLVFPEDTERAKPLIERYSELVKNLPEQPSSGCSDKAADQYDSSGSRPLKQRAQKQAQKQAQERAEDEEKDEFEFGDPDAQEALEEQPEEAPSGSEQSSGNESAPADDAGSLSDADGQAPLDGDNKSGGDTDGTEGARGGAGGAAAADAERDEQLEQEAQELAEEILEDVKERLSDVLRKDVGTISGTPELESTQSATPRLANSRSTTVDAEVASASRAFGLELERLRAKFDPDWERVTKHGKLNASRFMRGYEMDEVFDKWNIGREDVTDIEAVILLDVSGSMTGNRIKHAADAMWGIKRALDRVQASTTVLTFSSSSNLLYSAQEPAGITVRMPETWGGTNPSDALRYAQKLLAETGRAIRLLFVVTDGEWADAEKSEDAILGLRRAGVLTAQAFISGGYDTPADGIKSHGCEITSHIANPRDILFLGRHLVKLASARQLSSL